MSLPEALLGLPSGSTRIQVLPGPRPQLDPPHEPPIRQWTKPSRPGPALKSLKSRDHRARGKFSPPCGQSLRSHPLSNLNLKSLCIQKPWKDPNNPVCEEGRQLLAGHTEDVLVTCSPTKETSAVQDSQDLQGEWGSVRSPSLDICSPQTLSFQQNAGRWVSPKEREPRVTLSV